MSENGPPGPAPSAMLRPETILVILGVALSTLVAASTALSMLGFVRGDPWTLNVLVAGPGAISTWRAVRLIVQVVLVLGLLVGVSLVRWRRLSAFLVLASVWSMVAIAVRWREWIWIIEVPAWEPANLFVSVDSWQLGVGVALVPMALTILWVQRGWAYEREQEASRAREDLVARP